MEGVVNAGSRGLSVSESVASLGSTCANSSVGTGTVHAQLGSSRKRDMRAELEAWKAQKAAQKSKSRADAPMPTWQFSSPPKVDPMANLHPPLANGRPPAVPSPYTNSASAKVPRAPSSERRVPQSQLFRAASSASQNLGPKMPRLQRCSSDPTHPSGPLDRSGQVQAPNQQCQGQGTGRRSGRASLGCPGSELEPSVEECQEPRPSCQVGLAARFEAMSMSQSQSGRASLCSDLRESPSPRSCIEEVSQPKTLAFEEPERHERVDSATVGAATQGLNDEEDSVYNMELDSSVLYIESVLQSCLEAYDDERPELRLPPPTPKTPTTASALAAHRVMQDIMKEDAPLLPQRVLTVALGRLAMLGAPFVADDDDDDDDEYYDYEETRDTKEHREAQEDGHDEAAAEEEKHATQNEETQEEKATEVNEGKTIQTLQCQVEQEEEQETEEKEEMMKQQKADAGEAGSDRIDAEELRLDGDVSEQQQQQQQKEEEEEENQKEERTLELEAYLPKPPAEDLLQTPPPHRLTHFAEYLPQANASPQLSRTLFAEDEAASPLPLSPLSLESP